MIPIDDHLFIVCLLVTLGMQFSCFCVAAWLKFDKITDLSGSSNFVLLALLSLFVGGSDDPMRYTSRRIVMSTIVCASRVALALFLFYRVIRRGKDARFDGIRENFLSFLGFWTFQFIWVFGVSLTVIYVNTEKARNKDMNGVEILGAVLAAVGFVIAFLADVQKYNFRSNPAHSGAACTTGLWAWSRHPNYFGEILGWWGTFVMCVPVIQSSGSSVGYVTIISPLLTMYFLLLVSGLPTCEGKEQARYMRTPEEAKAYLDYRERTSIVIPLPPALYGSLPIAVKRVLFDLKRFEYYPEAGGTVLMGNGQSVTTAV